mmetsp:Transcript_376/g.506  ORF Transcript_376/g.506 Transcript_376/m.506 type:complete len:209 (+) Transcript_376:24-650(+)|eukprot:CAMPEP_0197032962 /NCGR_PEP_ID=MMETSP1384-20130603/11499_1 /TAXON_ID=29189 /ORGANISM="Ammonia sp." /LENGTH=208 /DNA_ID=CAMNT_0042462699 /DNA_START=20 /DNA_END=646 /DNA_ORIENTATION=-
MGNENAKMEKFQKEIFDLKFRSKQMQRQSKKFEKEYNDYRKKVKSAMEKGQLDVAKIHADTAIHKRNAGNQMLKLSSRIDAVTMRMESMLKQRQVTKQLAVVSRDLDPMINDNTMTKMTMAMDQFEQQFENLDIQSKVMESAMDTGTASAFNEDQVDGLLQQIADENAMDVKHMFEEAGIGEHKIKAKPELNDEEKEQTQKLEGLLDI